MLFDIALGRGVYKFTHCNISRLHFQFCGSLPLHRGGTEFLQVSSKIDSSLEFSEETHLYFTHHTYTSSVICEYI